MNYFKPSMRLLCMPKLSPTMTNATLNILYLKPSQFVTAYKLALEISTDSLLMIKSNTVSTMEVEVMEDMYVANIYVVEGKKMKVGEPIALLCEEKEEIEFAHALQIPPNFNAYDLSDGMVEAPIKMAMWQAYLKSTA